MGITGYISAIVLSVWLLTGGLPFITSFFDSLFIQVMVVILILPLIPMLPGLFTGSYTLRNIPLAYFYEFTDMYLAVFFILIYFPVVAVQVFSIIIIIALTAAALMLGIWILSTIFGFHFAAGLKYDDYLLLAVIIQGALVLLLVIRYSSIKLQVIAESIEDGTTGILDTMYKYMKIRRERINSLKK